MALMGALVMAGWVWDVDALKSIRTHWVTMKPMTAVGFVAAGLGLASSASRHDRVQALSVSFALGHLVLMGFMLLEALADIDLGFRSLLVAEGEGAVLTSHPGEPAICTMLAFILLACAVLDRAADRTTSRLLGFPVLASGALGLLGYVVDSPWLYCAFEGASSAMAWHTCLGFTLLGWAQSAR